MQSTKPNWLIAIATILLAVIYCNSPQFASSSKPPILSDVLSNAGEVSTGERNQNKYLILSHTLIQVHVREHSVNPFISGDITRINLEFKVKITTLLKSLIDVLNVRDDRLSLILFPFHSHW